MFVHAHKRGLFVFLVYTYVFGAHWQLSSRWYLPKCYQCIGICMYVCMQSTTVLNYKREKKRKGDLVSHSFDHHRSASIIIFLKFLFLFYFNCMFIYLCVCVWIEQDRRKAIGCRSINNGVVNVMSFTHNKRNSSLSTRITHQSNDVCINTYANLVVLSGSIDVLSILIIYLVTNVLYLIWLQRWEHDERERERERKRRARRRETCTDVVVVGAISSSSPSQ